MSGELERDVRDLQVNLARHLGECAEQGKTIFNTLARIEKRLDHSNNRLLGWIIGAQGAVLTSVFAAWLAHNTLFK